MRNNSLQLASMEQRRADENVLRLVEEQKVCSLLVILLHLVCTNCLYYNNFCLIFTLRSNDLILLIHPERERRSFKQDSAVGKAAGCQAEAGNGNSRIERETTGYEAS